MTPEEKQKLKLEIGNLPVWGKIKHWNSFVKIVDAMPEESECPLCSDKKEYWAKMLKEYEQFMFESENQIAKRKIEEWLANNEWFDERYFKEILNWLDREGK